MTTLITGSGLIGCHTAALLIRAGESVVILDRSPQPAHIASVVPLRQIAIETVDIRDRQALVDVMRRHRVRRVLHTAAALSLSIRQEPMLASDVNIQGTVNVLEAARVLPVERVVLASSTTVYYPIFHRPHQGLVAEDFSFHAVSERPGSLYAASKLAGEFFAQHYAATYGMSIAVLRYSAVLGLWAGPNHSVPGRLMAELLGAQAVEGCTHVADRLLMWRGGEDFIDAREVARANVAALNAISVPSVVYNIASGQMARFEDFVAAAREVSPHLTITHDAIPETGFAGFAYPRETPFDVSRAAHELGFSARHDLADSFRAAQPWVEHASSGDQRRN